jgi:1A family penicillin-binding protein
MKILKTTLKLLLLIIIVFFLIGVGIPVGVIIAYWNNLPSLEPLEYETQSWHYPTKVYSDITRIPTGTPLNSLLRRLERLEYKRIYQETPSEGQFYLKNPEDSEANEMIIYLRELDYPRLRLPSRLIAVEFAKGEITNISSIDQPSTRHFILEPEVISEFYGSEGTDRELVSLSQIPPILTKSFVAIEDKRFYKHWGFDPYRILGLVYLNLRHGRIVGGASTITQQLARDLFLTREQKITRKIKEALLAIKIERKYTKDEILERYLNNVNLGRYGSREIYGVGQAARYYFGKNVWELNIQESATLAGIPQNPPKYSPVKNPENCRSRRQLVLRQMLKEGFINSVQYKEAFESDLEMVPISDISGKKAAYFLEYIRLQLEEKYGTSVLYRRGLKVYTTLDMSMQLEASNAVQTQLRELDRYWAWNFLPYEENKAKWFAGERGNGVRSPKSYLQAALVSIDPATGCVKAMIGGRDFYVTPFNRAVKPHRQPGSAFKPFVYCTAFAHNMATPTTTVVDEPWGVRVPGGFWRPRNFKRRYYGRVTIRKMITKSINIATARFMYENIGFSNVDKVIKLASDMGVTSPLDPVPALALGSSAISLLELTSAYGVWANRGIRAEPICIKYVLDMENNILMENNPPPRRVLDEDVAYQITYLLQGVIKEGTGRNASIKFGFNRPAAGKTGTTNDETDAWFIGFVPDMVTGVWVGFDEYTRSVRRTGALAALPIWSQFMKSVVEGPVKDFAVPDGIVFRYVDADTGLPAREDSGNAIREAFIRGRELARK